MSRPRVGIDLGSTELKFMRMNPYAEILSIESIPLPIETEGHRVIHDPEVLWNRVKQVPGRLRLDEPWDAAIASQRSTFLLWDRDSGQTLTPILSWRDRRGADWIDRLSEDQFERIREITGLRPEPGYPLSKLIWWFEEEPSLRERAQKGTLAYGSLDTWLVWKATGGDHYRMDPTQASRTLLFDVKQQQWSDELLTEFDLPESLFPPVKEHPDQPIKTPELWDQGRVVHLIGDQPASTIGGQRPPYDFTRVTLGTGGFVASRCEPERVPDSLTVTFTPSPDGPVYQAEGVVLSAGRALDWLHKVYGLDRRQLDDFIRPPWPDDIPLFCPALNGVGAPFWSNRDAVMQGFTEDTSAKQMFTGLMVSVLFRIRDILEQIPRDDLRVVLDGGLTYQPYVASLAAALWDVPVSQALTPHLTPRGALVASHWSHSFFETDPWDTVDLEVTLPERDIPAERWWDRWQDYLVDWGLSAEA